MGYVLLTPPGSEPVSRTEAKLHLRVDSDMTEDDTLIDALITAARQYAEQQTRRSLVTQTWRLTLDAFPTGGFSMTPYLREFSIPDNAILLEKGPVSAVSSITYVDTSGTARTLADTEYIADLTGGLARIAPRFGKVWPPTLPQIGAVTVTFTAGYGAADDVPLGLKQWMLLRIGSLYAHREDLASLERGSMQPLAFVDALLDPYRIEVA